MFQTSAPGALGNPPGWAAVGALLRAYWAATAVNQVTALVDFRLAIYAYWFASPPLRDCSLINFCFAVIISSWRI